MTTINNNDIPFEFKYQGTYLSMRLTPTDYQDETTVLFSGRSYKILGDEAGIGILKERLNYLPSKELSALEDIVFRPPQSTILSEEFKHYCSRAPVKSVEISEKQKDTFLEKIKKDIFLKKIKNEETLKTAKRALEQIQYIPFTEFLDGLEMSTLKLRDHIKPSEPFIVLYDHALEKSGIWTTKLAYPFLEKAGLKPVRVEGWSWFDNTEPKVDETIKTIVIFDDASYSGTQITRAIEKKKASFEKHFPGHKIILVVPYATVEALEVIKKVGLTVIHTHLMPHFPSNLEFDFCVNDSLVRFKGSTATYFQHKLAAEGHSTVPLHTAGLVEKITPPYPPI